MTCAEYRAWVTRAERARLASPQLDALLEARHVRRAFLAHARRCHCRECGAMVATLVLDRGELAHVR